jgi:3'(2'), 5'-bisphosphate nucleotidase
MTVRPTDADARLARILAQAAGRALLEVRAGGSNGSALKAAGDQRAQAVLAALLAEHRPDDAVLSEEAADSADRRSGLDHRSAGRHARILRAASGRLGGARRALGPDRR